MDAHPHGPDGYAEAPSADRAPTEFVERPGPAAREAGRAVTAQPVTAPARPPLAAAPWSGTAPTGAEQDRAPEAVSAPDPGDGVDREKRSEDTPPGFTDPPVLTERVHRAFHAQGLPTQEQAAPDTVIEEADYPGLAVRGASLRGDGHRYGRESRQDTLGLDELECGGRRFVLACVSDGLGSCTMSHLGAASACRAMRRAVKRHLGELLDLPGGGGHVNRLGEQLFRETATAMHDDARREGLEAVELSSTLTAALVEITPEGEPAEFRLFALGDSPVYLLREGRMEPLTEQEEGIVASSGTYALPTGIGPAHTSEGLLRAGEVLLLCSDGLSNPMAASAVTDQLVAWWGGGRIPQRTEFAWQLDFQAKSFDDDRTAVCLWGR